ncbi:T9SS type A sorting domain-containing protein [candidate division WOR-3 bacterium]|nr:T9SS type A sorting domain-containing protein [candidate division WOR-3 bacterium]
MRILTIFALIAMLSTPLIGEEVDSEAITVQTGWTTEKAAFADTWAGPTSQYLADMDQAAKENAVIQLEWSGAPTEDMGYAEDLWNTGRFDESISLIEEIEEKLGDLAVATSYRNPIFTDNPKWADDVLVNSGGFNNRDVELIYGDNGHLFVLAEGDSSGYHRWFIYMSTDGGGTWAQTAVYSGSTNDINAVDGGEFPGYVYIAYNYDGAPTIGRLRRVFETNGAMDGGFGYVNAFTTTGNIQEVNFEPNRASWSEMYYSAICDLNVLHFFWTTDPTSWNGIATNTNNAERGLDMDYGWMSGSGHLIWISFINTADSLCARSLTGGPSWGVHNNIDDVHSASYFSTGIAQHGDTVLITFEDPSFDTRYRITYTDGGSWLVGTIDTDSSGAHDVTGRGNEGWQVSWATYTPGVVPEDVYHRTRTYASGAWSTPELVSEHDEFINYKTSIDYLGSAGAYGIAYINDNFDIYFDRLDWVPGVAEHTPVDDFSQFVTLAPNLTRSHVNLTIALSTEGMVKISMFDVTGRMVKNLMNETQPAGTYTLTIDNQNLAAGTYFVRVETSDGTTMKKMILIR